MKELSEKEYQENYEVFKKANNQIKENMLKAGLIDVSQIIKSVPSGCKNEIFKGIIK